MNLSDLITERKAGRSYEQLSKECGGTPTSKRLQQIATNDIKSFPDPETIRGLARGLKVSERAVLSAAAESLGIEGSAGDSKLETWLSSSKLRDLTDEQIDVILRVVDTMTTSSKSKRVPGGALLYIPNTDDRTEPEYSTAKWLLDDVFPDRDSDTEYALLHLARRLSGPLAVELRQLKKAGEGRELSSAPNTQAETDAPRVAPRLTVVPSTPTVDGTEPDWISDAVARHDIDALVTGVAAAWDRAAKVDDDGESPALTVDESAVSEHTPTVSEYDDLHERADRGEFDDAHDIAALDSTDSDEDR